MLEEFCRRENISAEFIEFESSTKTAEDAARALDTTPEHIIKSLLFFADEEPILVIVRGVDRANPSSIAEVLGSSTCRLATPEEVEEETGYVVGAVPPVGLDVRKVIDEKVLEMDKVYGGAGTRNRVMGVDPRFLVHENDTVGEVTR